MAALSSSLFASSRRSRVLGLLVAGGILFVIGIGGSGVFVGASATAVAERAEDQSQGAA